MVGRVCAFKPDESKKTYTNKFKNFFIINNLKG
jgi:hypothetical protein